jgi:hypothetical protein
MTPPDLPENELPENELPRGVPQLSHDFNNLLQVVVGNLELLKRHMERREILSLPRETLVHPIEAALKAAREASDLGEHLTDLLKESRNERKP